MFFNRGNHCIFQQKEEMEKQISVIWKGNMAFEAQIEGFKLMMDAVPASGGEHLGPTPKPLLMASLGGCTGMDVISLVRKMRQEVESLEIFLTGSITEEHPMHYEAIHLIYEFTGKELDAEKLQKAVDLSQEKYCGVADTLKRAVKVTYEIRIR